MEKINVNIVELSQHCSSISFQKYEEEWHKLFNSNNLEELQKYALCGYLRASRFRSIYWFLFLNILPKDSSLWLNELIQLRKNYNEVKKKFSYDPRSDDVTNDDPLSQKDNSIWNRHFCDEELRTVIKQDVIRTFPGVDFFRKSQIQKIMISILFIYARQNPVMCYRQGMHELLAPLLFVLHCDHQAMLHTSEQTFLDETIKEMLNPKCLEEDGYNLFLALMDKMFSCYNIIDVAPTSTGYFPTLSKSEKSFDEKECENVNEVVYQLNSIRDNILLNVDPQLTEHLKLLEISLPLFGIRWLRLLFGREFPLQDLLVLWDAIFSREDFIFVHYVVVAMLVAIRKQLLEGDYTTCLMLLMKYPTNIDISFIIKYALHLHYPQEFSNPPALIEQIYVPNLHKKQSNTLPEVKIQKTNSITVCKESNSSKNFTKNSKRCQKWTTNDISENPEKLLKEVKHAHSIMNLSRLKLLQYHKTLSKVIPNNDTYRDALLALNGIQELCSLLTSRLFIMEPFEVEHAIEAGEIRPTELTISVNTNANNQCETVNIPKTKDKEMKLYTCIEGESLNGVPMIDPTHKL